MLQCYDAGFCSQGRIDVCISQSAFIWQTHSEGFCSTITTDCLIYRQGKTNNQSSETIRQTPLIIKCVSKIDLHQHSQSWIAALSTTANPCLFLSAFLLLLLRLWGPKSPEVPWLLSSHCCSSHSHFQTVQRQEILTGGSMCSAGTCWSRWIPKGAQAAFWGKPACWANLPAPVPSWCLCNCHSGQLRWQFSPVPCSSAGYLW